MHYWNRCVKHVSGWQAGACCSLLPCDDWPVSLVRILAQLNHEQECEISCVHRWHAFCHHSLLVRHTNTLGWLVTDYMLMGGFNQITKSKLAAQVRFWGEKHNTTWMKDFILLNKYFSDGNNWFLQRCKWRGVSIHLVEGVWTAFELGGKFHIFMQVPLQKIP